MKSATPLTVRLLEADPDLADRLPPGAREEATRLMRTQVVVLAPGALDVAALRGKDAALRGLLLLDGLLARMVRVGDVVSLQLLGRGDVVEVAGDPLGDQLVPMEMSWTVVEPVHAAAIDDGALRWPAVAAALFERASAQAARSAARCAISQLSRVEVRVETLLWFLAERFGRIAPDGVLLPLRLTHEAIGQMIGARRPTVSLALKTLEHEGAVERRADGTWVLRRPSAPLAELTERPCGGIRWISASPADGPPGRRAAAAARR